MRKNFGAKPLSYPQAVYIIATWNEDGTANAMNAAWGGVSNDHEFTLCLSANHKTVKNLQKTGAFTVSMGDAAHVTQCDYVGLASGNRDADKLSKAGFTVSKSEFVNAPVINELAVCVECNVISYDEKTCVLVGDIVNVSVSESAMTDGKVDIRKVRPIVFDPFNADYLEIGEKVGKAFSDGKSLMKK
ncbi:MAG: flavin reductase [Spirochaetales bacterium]|nr:flavin reductase [Spirochaetales bacterium]